MNRFVVALLGTVLSAAAMAADFVAQVQGREGLVLTLPAGWSAHLDQSQPGLPPTVKITSADRTAFQVLITPIPTTGGRSNSPTEIRKLVERGLDNIKASAVESSISIQELAASDKAGYYFSATDRQPEPEGYKYLTQGALAFGDLKVTFTVLTNRQQGEVARQVIDMLRSAKRSPRGNAA